MADERAALASDSSQAASSKKVAPLIAISALAIVGLVAWRVFYAGPSTPSSIVELTGRVEGDDSAVAAKVAGRILEIRVREGDEVRLFRASRISEPLEFERGVLPDLIEVRAR